MSYTAADFIRLLRRIPGGQPYKGPKQEKGSPVSRIDFRIAGTRDAMVGKVLEGKYEIRDRIGTGAMSIVYRAIQHPIDRPVAIKILKKEWCESAATVKRFSRESKALSTVTHPNIVAIHDVGTMSNGQPFMVMEYLQGRSLEHRIEKEGPLPPEEVAEIFIPICDAMAKAHNAGLIHRDLKPANIMLCRDSNDQPLVKLVDFGVVKFTSGSKHVFSQKLTAKGETWGSPTYMSPEQCMGHELDARSDIYSLGLVLYEALTGSFAVNGKNVPQILAKQMTEMPPPFIVANPGLRIHESFEELTFRCLEKDPAKRFWAMTDLSEALGKALEQSKISAAESFTKQDQVSASNSGTPTSRTGSDAELSDKLSNLPPRSSSPSGSLRDKQAAMTQRLSPKVLISIASILMALILGYFAIFISREEAAEFQNEEAELAREKEAAGIRATKGRGAHGEKTP